MSTFTLEKYNTSMVELPAPAALRLYLCAFTFDQQKIVNFTVNTISAASFPSTIWMLILLVLILSNLKNVPGIYHLRLLNAFRFVLRSQRTTDGPKPEQLFQPIITSSMTTLMETDLNMHKSNSTYFSDVDIARTHLICTLFSKGIEKARGCTTGIMHGKISSFGVALGAVSCSFQQELKPYEPYEMWTRILTWDKKWLYVVTHFVKKDAHIEPGKMTLHDCQNTVTGRNSMRERTLSVNEKLEALQSSANYRNSAKFKYPIAASALSKLVFKNGRITIAPEVMLEASGLLPPRPVRSETARSDCPTETQIKINAVEVAERQVASAKVPQTIDEFKCSDSESSHSSGRTSVDELTLDQWRWDAIESERVRGLDVASALASQSNLENELSTSEALGRHTDGCGIAGVVLTLAQLANMSDYQFL